MMNNNTMLESDILQQTEKLLYQAYHLQNSQIYDEAYEKLDAASRILIDTIENIKKNPQFYMKVMPIMKHQRQLISQRQYKQFWSKNQKVLCRNFQKNAYRALIMQQIQQKQYQESRKSINQQFSINQEKNKHNLQKANTLKSPREKCKKITKNHRNQ